MYNFKIAVLLLKIVFLLEKHFILLILIKQPLHNHFLVFLDNSSKIYIRITVATSFQLNTI